MAHYVVVEGGHDRAHEDAGARARAARHHGQHHPARSDRHADEPPCAPKPDDSVAARWKTSVATSRCAASACPRTSPPRARTSCPTRPATSPDRSSASTAAASPDRPDRGAATWTSGDGDQLEIQQLARALHDVVDTQGRSTAGSRSSRPTACTTRSAPRTGSSTSPMLLKSAPPGQYIGNRPGRRVPTATPPPASSTTCSSTRPPTTCGSPGTGRVRTHRRRLADPLALDHVHAPQRRVRLRQRARPRRASSPAKRSSRHRAHRDHDRTGDPRLRAEGRPIVRRRPRRPTRPGSPPRGSRSSRRTSTP